MHQVRLQMTDTHIHLGLKLCSPCLSKCFHQWIAKPELQSLIPRIPPLWTFSSFFHSGTASAVSPASQQQPGHSAAGPIFQASRETLYKPTITSGCFKNKHKILSPASSGMTLSPCWVLFWSEHPAGYVTWCYLPVLIGFSRQLSDTSPLTPRLCLPSPSTSLVTCTCNLGDKFILRNPRPK